MNILVCVDLFDSMSVVLAKAEQLATAFNAKIWLLHVAEPEPDFVGFETGPQSVRDSLADHYHQEHKQLQAFADLLRGSDLEVAALLVQGATANTILAQAEKVAADFIIVGSHGKGKTYRLLVGSVSESVIYRADCPVLVVPTHQRAAQQGQ